VQVGVKTQALAELRRSFTPRPSPPSSSFSFDNTPRGPAACRSLLVGGIANSGVGKSRMLAPFTAAWDAFIAELPEEERMKYAEFDSATGYGLQSATGNASDDSVSNALRGG